MTNDFTARLTGRFVDDEDFPRTGRVWIEINNSVGTVDIPLPQEYRDAKDQTARNARDVAGDKQVVERLARQAQEASTSAASSRSTAQSQATQAQASAIQAQNSSRQAQDSASQAASAAQQAQSVARAEAEAAARRFVAEMKTGPRGERGPQGPPGEAGRAGRDATLPTIINVVRGRNQDRGSLVSCWNDGMLHCESNPSSHNHLARKGWIDTQMNSLSSRITNLELPVRARNSSAVSGTIMVRDNESRVQVADPDHPSDCATKRYVDRTLSAVSGPETLSNGQVTFYKIGRMVFVQVSGATAGTKGTLPAAYHPIRDVDFFLTAPERRDYPGWCNIQTNGQVHINFSSSSSVTGYGVGMFFTWI